MTRRGVVASVALAVALAAVALIGSGCASVTYVSDAVRGHVDVMARARPVADVVADPQTSSTLRERLLLSQRMRDFAIQELKLPDNASYRRYADLQRSAVVWNVAAAPPLSLKLQTWCYAVVGCVAYRGYYAREQADATAQDLRGKGLDVAVGAVPAYSTLGWLNWLGGDPLLNTFVNQGEQGLARLIFHELAHQVVYVGDDTAFNESFASAVDRLGSERWMRLHASPAARESAGVAERRRAQFRALTSQARTDLDAVYRGNADDDAKLAAKAEVFARLRADYERVKARDWRGFAGYDEWMANANNASLALQGAYSDLVPAFERLFYAQGGDFERFYAAVKRLGDLPRNERRATLRKGE